jgi:phosphoglycolate phosphatase-like HAD superfamily hydrolase
MTRRSKKYNNSQIEIINSNLVSGQIHYALFDFDGTISLIREGWQGVMIPMMVDLLTKTPHPGLVEELPAIVSEYVGRLTGKQTIYQMIKLAEEIEKRGGTPSDPLAYKSMYHERLMDHIQERIGQLNTHAVAPSEMMVPGALEFLQLLAKKGIACYLASGTDEVYVLEEARLLGLTKYFQGIYGALDNYKEFSKRMVIQRILKENSLRGLELVAFGDGYVEIEDVKSVGGIAVGVATDEAARQGVDEWKRSRLIAAGADVIIPDFREYQTLGDLLWSTD